MPITLRRLFLKPNLIALKVGCFSNFMLCLLSWQHYPSAKILFSLFWFLLQLYVVDTILICQSCYFGKLSLSATSLQLYGHLRMDWHSRIMGSICSTCYFAFCSFRILLWWLFGLKRPNKLLSNFPNLISLNHSASCSMLNIISSDWNEAQSIYPILGCTRNSIPPSYFNILRQV